ESIGLPAVVLMENAGAAVARVVDERFASARRLLILCGKGNNGGDGFVAARRLLRRRPEGVLLGQSGDVKGDARLHHDAFLRSGGAVREAPDADAWRLLRDQVLAGADLVVDAILGTGLREAPTGAAGQAIADLCRFADARGTVVAVDVPSGLPSDTGRVAWETARATVTVTFAAPKYGHVLPPACDRVGDLVVADIGIARETLEGVGASCGLLEDEDAARAFPPRAVAAHKGTFGHVLVI